MSVLDQRSIEFSGTSSPSAESFSRGIAAAIAITAAAANTGVWAGLLYLTLGWERDFVPYLLGTTFVATLSAAALLAGGRRR